MEVKTAHEVLSVDTCGWAHRPACVCEVKAESLKRLADAVDRYVIYQQVSHVAPAQRVRVVNECV